MTQVNPIQSITVIGRRWFNSRVGWTSFSALIPVNGKTVANINGTGGGSHYVDEAFKWLDENGYNSDRPKHANGSSETPWAYCQDRGIALEFTASDVARKKDL